MTGSKVKYDVYLTVEGMERHAKNDKLYNWHFSLFEHDSEPYSNYKKVGEVVLNLPPVGECIQPVLDYIKERETTIQADTFAELKKLHQRRNDLLTIGFSQPTEVGVTDEENSSTTEDF